MVDDNPDNFGNCVFKNLNQKLVIQKKTNENENELYDNNNENKTFDKRNFFFTNKNSRYPS